MKFTVQQVIELGRLVRRAVDDHDVDAAFEVCRVLDDIVRLIVKEDGPGGKTPL